MRVTGLALAISGLMLLAACKEETADLSGTWAHESRKEALVIREGAGNTVTIERHHIPPMAIAYTSDSYTAILDDENLNVGMQVLSYDAEADILVGRMGGDAYIRAPDGWHPREGRSALVAN